MMRFIDCVSLKVTSFAQGGQARDDWEILRDLILAISGQNGLYTIDDVFKSLAAEVPD